MLASLLAHKWPGNIYIYIYIVGLLILAYLDFAGRLVPPNVANTNTQKHKFDGRASSTTAAAKYKHAKKDLADGANHKPSSA